MKIYCSYNHKYHIFLNKVVELVLNQYGSDLNINTLKEIELRNIDEFEIKTDGRTVGNNKIIVTSRLYDFLPTLNIEKYLPYFIARTEDDNIRDKYICIVRNSLLIEYINEADTELKNLEKYIHSMMC